MFHGRRDVSCFFTNSAANKAEIGSHSSPKNSLYNNRRGNVNLCVAAALYGGAIKSDGAERS